MTRPVPQYAIDFIEGAEACVLTPYLDSTGHWTDGYGNTVGVIPNGPPITMDKARADLVRNLATAAEKLAGVVNEPVILDLTGHQYSALISFVFNLGAKPEWTIWKDLNSGNLADVPTQIKRFDKGVVDGKLVAIRGLDHRRLAECVLWAGEDELLHTSSSAVAAAVATVQAAPVPAPPSSVTRDVLDTPPTPTPLKPFDLTSIGTKVGTAAAGVGVVASQINGVIAPHVGDVPILQHAVMALGMVVVACGIIGVLIHNAQAQAAKV